MSTGMEHATWWNWDELVGGEREETGAEVDGRMVPGSPNLPLGGASSTDPATVI